MNTEDSVPAVAIKKVHFYSNQPERGTLIDLDDDTFVWTRECLSLNKDEQRLSTIAALGSALMRLTRLRRKTQDLYPTAMEVKGALTSILAQSSIGLDAEATRAILDQQLAENGALQDRMESAEIKMTRQSFEMCGELANLGVYRIRSGDIAISPTAETEDPQRVHDIIASIRLDHARAKWHASVDAMDAHNLAAQSGFPVEWITSKMSTQTLTRHFGART
ncbi:MAG: hypothetical protein UY05_C0017G0004 [Candidatus Peregrinibacteria bacterium GW2011_GWA2_47_7]|nr:MAG: hypothetical protein UY05_C0017G0004 [Candidatus Peregrinibacteria bacterium GW2011_GWA2_47_7]